MAQKLILSARCSGRTLEVIEHLVGIASMDGMTPRDYYDCGPGELPVSWSLTGRKVRDGSLIGADTIEHVIERAMAGVRRHSPRARIVVTYCSLCGTGQAPGIECRHVG